MRHISRLAKSISMAAMLTVGLGGEAPAQQPMFGDTEITTQDLGQGVYMMLGAGGNLGVSVGQDGVFIIDDQFAPMTEKIIAAVGAITDQPVKYVFNTHWHGDHTGGNENFGKAGAIIVAHDNVRERMSKEQFVAAFNSKVDPAPEVALPVITFAQNMTFHLNEDTIHIVHVGNAHTDGDSIIYFESADVLHMGDTFFRTGGYPFIDVSSGGSIDGAIEALDKGIELSGPQTKVIPGHGPLGTQADMIAMRDALTNMRAQVAELVDKGMDLEAIVAANPLAAYEKDWGGRMLKGSDMVNIIYAGLTK